MSLRMLGVSGQLAKLRLALNGLKLRGFRSYYVSEVPEFVRWPVWASGSAASAQTNCMSVCPFVSCDDVHCAAHSRCIRDIGTNGLYSVCVCIVTLFVVRMHDDRLSQNN